MKHRGRREGSFRKVRNRWEGRVYLAGMGRHAVYAATKEDAQRALRKLVDDLEKGIRPPDPAATVGDWLTDWLASIRVAPRTMESYRYVADYHLRPTLGTVPIARLSAGHVTRLLEEKAAANLSPTTVRYIYAVLRIALGRAVKAGRVTRNVCELVDPPRKARTEISILTDAETQTLLRALAASPHECLIVLSLATGLRQGELCGLWWSDLDLDAATVTVRAQLSRGGTTRVEPKVGSRRIVGIPPIAVASLRSHLAKALEANFGTGKPWTEDRWVFLNDDGRPLQGWSAYHALQTALRDAGVRSVRFHSMRHAYASALLGDGEDMGNVSKLLGHRTVVSTINQYGHLVDQARTRAAERMERKLRRAT